MATPSKLKLIIGMSGGVDSSVAALLLQAQGYSLRGLFMKNWEEDDRDDYCAAAVDLTDATAVAKQLELELLTINFASEYWDRVFEHFLAEYRVGRTPNPDILCNKEIKFRAFLDYALSLGADKIATGHYARTRYRDGEWQLLKGVDSHKDQSYFLHALNQYQLSHSLFPLGELTKPEVRQFATEAELATSQKRDSTGICFIGERRFSDFLQRYLPAQPGEIVTETGAVIGQHQGLMFYTIGQRQGLGIGGLKGYPEEPWFVAAKDLTHNRLVVVQGYHHPRLFYSALIATQQHWISPTPPALPLRCQAKIRYRQADQPCTITALDPQQWRIDFDSPQRAVTSGQSIVFYQGEITLGGAIIERGID
ncbi:tRNA 2-thiouridine(34) synthase MnmA [Ectothiorhodospiraceae bacterium BW-2]|nr:tRNA 2-thiouridine(34) synthase MnmA [Ectothiorhodospiraceae bacterium BW-2]